MEIWKDVVGYEGLYQVSSFGRVRSLHSGQPKLRAIFKHPIWNYWWLLLMRRGTRRAVKVHRLVAQAFIPNPLNKPQVNHIDGNRLNNLLTNLEWNTHQENMSHASRTGLMPKRNHHGEKNPNYRHGRYISPEQKLAA